MDVDAQADDGVPGTSDTEGQEEAEGQIDWVALLRSVRPTRLLTTVRHAL